MFDIWKQPDTANTDVAIGLFNEMLSRGLAMNPATCRTLLIVLEAAGRPELIVALARRIQHERVPLDPDSEARIFNARHTFNAEL